MDQQQLCNPILQFITSFIKLNVHITLDIRFNFCIMEDPHMPLIVITNSIISNTIFKEGSSGS